VTAGVNLDYEFRLKILYSKVNIIKKTQFINTHQLEDKLLKAKTNFKDSIMNRIRVIITKHIQSTAVVRG
jgi:hypothetical protein